MNERGLAPGTTFAGHRIEAVAGRGGMGVVYRARHIALDHVVALKVISPELVGDERFRQRFQSESRIAVSIRHPNVVSVHHAGEEEGLLFVTMDYIEGTDLRGLLNREGWLEPDRATTLLAPLADALDAAHSRGLIHRDIKPGNVLIEPRDGGEHVYLTDFGLARAIDAETGLTASGAFIGTLDYAAPEQIKGERLDARTDVYALGCLLHEMLCGSTLFAKQTEKVAKMYAHLMEAPPDVRELRPDLPADLADAVQRAVAKEPDRRFPSAGDLARAASAAAAGRAVSQDERTVAIGKAAPAAPTAPLAAPPTAPADAPGPEPTGTAEAPPPTEPPATRPDPTVPGGPVPGPEAPRPERRATHSTAARRRRLVAGLAALGVVAAIVVVVLLAGGGGSDEEPRQAASGGSATGGGGGGGAEAATFADSRAAVAGKPIDVEGMPVGIAVSEESDTVWVGSRLGGRLTPIDPRTGKPGDPIDGLAAPEGVASGPASVYVALSDSNEVLRVNERTGREARIPVGTTPRAVVHGGDGIYVTNAGSNTVVPVEIAPTAETPGTPIPVGEDPHGIAVGEGSVWITNRAGGTVSEIELGADQVGRTIEVGSNPKGIAYADRRLWVANTDDDSVSVIDGQTAEVEATIDVADEPRGVIAAFGSVWVANGGGSVTRIDPESAEVDQEIGVDGSPEELAAGAQTIWVTTGTADQVVRIEPEG